MKAASSTGKANGDLDPTFVISEFHLLAGHSVDGNFLVLRLQFFGEVLVDSASIAVDADETVFISCFHC